MNFFTSDTHFYDLETLSIDDRPFKSAKQFDNYVLKTWNKQAKKGDTIFVIGADVKSMKLFSKATPKPEFNRIKFQTVADAVMFIMKRPDVGHDATLKFARSG